MLNFLSDLWSYGWPFLGILVWCGAWKIWREHCRYHAHQLDVDDEVRIWAAVSRLSDKEWEERMR
jgi:hypothetical protein